MAIDVELNYFEILGVDQKFTQDNHILNRRLAELQAQVHPDKFVQATFQEKQLAMQYSVKINEAYGVLKDPFKRALHLLELNGIELSEGINIKMSSEFLMSQMAFREKLDLAKMSSNPQLRTKEVVFDIQSELRQKFRELPVLLDNVTESSISQAILKVREMQFFIRLEEKAKTLLEEPVSIN